MGFGWLPPVPFIQNKTPFIHLETVWNSYVHPQGWSSLGMSFRLHSKSNLLTKCPYLVSTILPYLRLLPSRSQSAVTFPIIHTSRVLSWPSVTSPALGDFSSGSQFLNSQSSPLARLSIHSRPRCHSQCQLRGSTNLFLHILSLSIFYIVL
jgi:hypothetical protein